MSHLDDGLIQELVDGEVPSRDLPPIQTHLAGCAVCRARLDAARGMAGEADQLLTILDAPAVIARPAGPKQSPVDERSSSSPFAVRRSLYRRLAWAASLVVAVGLGYAGRDLVTDGGGRVEGALIAPQNDGQVAAISDQRSAISDVGGALVAPPAPPPPPAQVAVREEPRRASVPQPSAAGAEHAAPQSPAIVAPQPSAAASDRQLPMERMEALGAVVSAAPPASTARQARSEAAAMSSGAAPAPVLTDEQQKSFEAASRRDRGIEEVDLPTAMALLGGRIRLIDGMVPDRLEARGDTVTVVYPSSYGPLRVVQRLDGEEIVWQLLGSVLIPADSVRVWRSRVRQ